MRGMILIVHGSRDPKWRNVFGTFMEKVTAALPGQAVILAFMELASPTLEEAVVQLIESGCNEIEVLPLFMADGGHVDHDIPAQIRDTRVKFPSVVLNQLPPVGKHPAVQAAMIQIIQTALQTR